MSLSNLLFMRINVSQFGKLLKYFRLEAGMSQRRLSILANINAGHISRIERSLKSPPRSSTIMKLVSAMALNKEEVAQLFIAAGYQPPQEPVLLGFTSSLIKISKKPPLPERVARLDRPAKNAIESLLDILSVPSLTKIQRKAVLKQIIALSQSLNAIIEPNGLGDNQRNGSK